MSEQKKKTASVSRYPGQRIVINDSVTVKISRIEGKRVYLYIEGPEKISIIRPSKEEDRSDREKAGRPDPEDDEG
jgi:sRNA-binding carbon storage regulator CsrA